MKHIDKVINLCNLFFSMKRPILLNLTSRGLDSVTMNVGSTRNRIVGTVNILQVNVGGETGQTG